MKKRCIFFLMLISSLVLMTACNEKEVMVSDEREYDDLGSQYSEEILSYPDEIAYVADICILDNGNIRIAGMDKEYVTGSIWDSGDGGRSWTMQMNYTDKLNDNEIIDTAVSLYADGSFLCSIEIEDDHGEEEVEHEEHIRKFFRFNNEDDYNEININDTLSSGDITILKAGGSSEVLATNIWRTVAILSEEEGKVQKVYEEEAMAFSAWNDQLYILTYDGAMTFETDSGKQLENDAALEFLMTDVLAEAEEDIFASRTFTAYTGESEILSLYYGDRKGIFCYTGNVKSQLCDGTE